jgi:hypothetical protein
MVMPADNRKAWMGNEWAAAHKLMFAQRGGSTSTAKAFSGPIDASGNEA